MFSPFKFTLDHLHKLTVHGKNNYSCPLHTKERIECFSKILVYLSGKFYPLCAPHKQNLNELDLCASRNFYSCFRKLTKATRQGHGGQVQFTSIFYHFLLSIPYERWKTRQPSMATDTVAYGGYGGHGGVEISTL